MFDPRQRPMGRPMPQRAPWMQQLGQGLAAQQPQWNQPQPQGGPPPGVRFMPQGGGMPPQAAGPDQRPMAPPGAGFLRDQDAAIRAALARRRQPVPVEAQGGAAPPQGIAAGEPDADERGGPRDGDQDDPRARMGAYR